MEIPILVKPLSSAQTGWAAVSSMCIGPAGQETLHTTPDLSQWLNLPRDSLYLGASWLVALGCFPHGKDTFVVTGIDAYPGPGFTFLTHCFC